MIGASESPKENIKKAMEMAQKAMALGDADYEVQGLLCYIYTVMRKFDEAIEAGKRVISMSPGSANSYGYLSLPVLYSGDPSRAILLLEKAMRLNPIPPNFYFVHLGIAYRMMGQYYESLESYKKFYDRSPNNVIALIGMAAAYSLLGNNQEARTQAEEVMKVDPDFSLDDWIKRMPFKKQEDRDILYKALRATGLK
jgi:tetratricopeptide (TPR) repeat protein